MPRHWFWCEGAIEDQNLYWDSKITTLPGVSKTKGTLLEAAGFHILSDLRNMTQQRRKELLNVKSVGHKTVQKWEKKLEEIAGDTAIEPPQHLIDHRLAENPYIYTETENIMKGTPHEKDWYFFHDALSLMTSADPIAWMERMGYYDRWLLPKFDLLEGTIYHRSLPGDSPECMPMDNVLNKNIDDAAICHVAVTIHLSKTDPRKYSLATHTQLRCGARHICFVDAPLDLG
mmetsp:Transcript_32653/g.64725  ORF Transcript_32653/g.64725 Transcript_32653/m.64725 type:complete len:231 (+) Transcript_32653:1189-1881(+)